MEGFIKSTKNANVAVSKSANVRSHPYKSRQTTLKEICCNPRPAGNIFNSSTTGHQVNQGPGGHATSYFASRNQKLARQFKENNLTPLTESSNPAQPSDLPIFRNCAVYINGYMGPLISDIELKRRLARHGARVVVNFGRKSVTHVILGPNGLAGGKIQKEMLAKKVEVKYVTVDWCASLTVMF
jgi:hypothetical protein